MSYQEWKRAIEVTTTQKQEFHKEESDEGVKPSGKQHSTGLNETINKIKKLCRVCSSNGLISIKSTINRNLLRVKPSGDIRKWQIPISEIIACVSGEKVNHKRPNLLNEENSYL